MPVLGAIVIGWAVCVGWPYLLVLLGIGFASLLIQAAIAHWLISGGILLATGLFLGWSGWSATPRKPITNWLLAVLLVSVLLGFMALVMISADRNHFSIWLHESVITFRFMVPATMLIVATFLKALCQQLAPVQQAAQLLPEPDPHAWIAEGREAAGLN